MNNIKSKRYTYTLLIFFALACTALTLFTGEISWDTAKKGFLEKLCGLSNKWNPLFDERIPRLITTFLTGASLAVSGAVTQSLFQNPLGSPSVLGISAGSSLSVVTVLTMGVHLYYPFLIPLSAIFGCLITLIIVYNLSKKNGIINVHTIILTGVAISTLMMACQGILLYAMRDNWHLIQTIAEWESGSTMDRSWDHVNMQMPLAIVGLYGCWRYRRELDVLALGYEEAQNLGIDIKSTQKKLFLYVSLLVGGAIAVVGNVAFFGLVLPHLLRQLYGPSNKHLIPLCMIVGAVTFSGMDLVLRIFHIQLLTLGNISAILGGIFFLVLLLKSKSQRTYV